MKACVGINVNCDSSKPILCVNQIDYLLRSFDSRLSMYKFLYARNV